MQVPVAHMYSNERICVQYPPSPLRSRGEYPGENVRQCVSYAMILGPYVGAADIDTITTNTYIHVHQSITTLFAFQKSGQRFSRGCLMGDGDDIQVEKAKISR
jgi:hypothetical protein